MKQVVIKEGYKINVCGSTQIGAGMFDFKQTMDKIVDRELKAGNIMGANVLVLHHNKEIYSNTFGYADRENEIPMKRDTIFRMFSMTKPVTAAAVMILAERGELDLKDPVSMYLPAFHGQKVWEPSGRICPAKRDITIWDLMCMASGIPYPCRDHEPGRQMDDLFQELIGRRLNGERVDTQEYLGRIAQVPLRFQPGEKYIYGLSADVLGGVVEVIARKSYGQYLKEELFDPLGMKDTGFFVPEEKKCRFARNYEWSQEQGKLIPYEGNHLGVYYGEDVAFESGGAGLVSTIDDYSHFARMMVQKGEYNGKRIMGRKTVEFMNQDRLTADQKEFYNGEAVRGYGYGCLMRVLKDQGEAGTIASLGEYGWDGWTGNYVVFDPADDMVLLYLIQRCGAGTTPAVRKLRMAAYAALED